MRDHADHYKQFIEVCPGGGTRRNPKRKNAGAFSSPINAAAPSTADIQRVFDTYLQRMAQGGTYGDNMEIAAFARVFEADVMIWQRDLNYIIPGPTDKSSKPLCHIAYHVCPLPMTPADLDADRASLHRRGNTTHPSATSLALMLVRVHRPFN